MMSKGFYEGIFKNVNSLSLIEICAPIQTHGPIYSVCQKFLKENFTGGDMNLYCKCVIYVVE